MTFLLYHLNFEINKKKNIYFRSLILLLKHGFIPPNVLKSDFKNEKCLWDTLLNPHSSFECHVLFEWPPTHTHVIKKKVLTILNLCLFIIRLNKIPQDTVFVQVNK